MSIDRVANTRLTARNPVERTYASERQMNETGDDFARCGYSTLDRADQKSYFNRNRRGLTSPARNEANSDYGDETYTTVNVIY